MLKNKIFFASVALLLMLFCYSCASLRKANIEIPQDVRSKSVVQDIPKENQKEVTQITVVSSEKVVPEQELTSTVILKSQKQKAKGKKNIQKEKPAPPVLNVVKNPFKVGEIIKLDLYYIGLRAATLTVETKPFVDINGRKAFHFYGIAQTTSLMKYIYRVYDVIDSYVDFEYFIPLKTTLTMDESKQNVSMVINYDHKKGKSSFWKKRIDAKGVVTEINRDDDLTIMAQDTFSSLYYVRTHDLKVGDKIKFVVHDNEKNWTLILDVIKNEKIWTRLGDIDCLLLHPTVEREGEKFTKAKMNLWVTNDERKIPVKFEAEVKVGSMKGYIKDYIVPKD